MKKITDLKHIKGKVVVLRVDYNVPIVGGRIIDPSRIIASFKSITELQKKGAIIILIAHREKNETLLPVAAFLKKNQINVTFIDTKNINGLKQRVVSTPPGSVFLLENIRTFSGEEKNSVSFSKQLAAQADIYINDAFSVSHRKHASVVGIARYIPVYAGYAFIEEIKMLSKVRTPKHPLVVILGGIKFSTKLPLLNAFKTAQATLVGGALANTLLRERGYEIGSSVADTARIAKTISGNDSILTPLDVVLETGVIVSISDITPKDTIVDIGPKTAAHWCSVLSHAKTIIWNGPLGWYEKGFTKSSLRIWNALKKSSATVVIGGGDTGAVITDKKIPHHCFISQGGGATLTYLATGTLPGIAVLE